VADVALFEVALGTGALATAAIGCLLDALVTLLGEGLGLSSLVTTDFGLAGPEGL